MKCPAKAHQVEGWREFEAEVVIAKDTVEGSANGDAGAEGGEIAKITKMPDLIGRCE